MAVITPAQQAAIYLYIFGGCKDRKILFEIAEGKERVNAMNPNSLKTTVNNWFNSHKIQEGMKAIKADHERILKEYADSKIKELETEGTTGSRKNKNQDTDFLDRDEFLKFLNDRANDRQLDDKTRNDILKMLSDNLRYKDADKNEIEEIQRFYTPVNCKDCEIYRRCSGCSGCSVAADA